MSKRATEIDYAIVIAEMRERESALSSELQLIRTAIVALAQVAEFHFPRPYPIAAAQPHLVAAGNHSAIECGVDRFGRPFVNHIQNAQLEA
jgi:hypothetical protein